MITDIHEKKIDCIIVKDLSRFGRNYIETGKYIEQIFPASTMYRTLPGIRKYSKTGQEDSCNAYISHICSVEEKNKNLFYLSG